MQVLIWAVFVSGALAARYFFGVQGRLLYLVAIAAVIALFRRQLVIGLTHVAARLGLMKQTIDRMPMTITLERAAGLEAAARTPAAELAAAGFVDAGAWNIVQLPKIGLGLMVHPRENFLAAIETASSIGAQVNIHTLYSNGDVLTCTNSRLPAPKVQRPGVTSIRMPGVAPSELLAKARSARRRDDIDAIPEKDAAPTYQRLYAESVRFRKAQGR